MARYIQQLRRGWKDDMGRDDWAMYEDSKYIQTKVYNPAVTYYEDKSDTVAYPQPTKVEVENGNYYIKNPQYTPPLEGELVLEYDNGVPRLKIGDGEKDFSALPYMGVESFVAPKHATITLYGGETAWQAVEGYERRYTQDITNQLVGKITPNSKVDLQPTPEQLYSFQSKDVTFTTVNENGTVRVCAIGEIPTHDYENIQVTITEVAANG